MPAKKLAYTLPDLDPTTLTALVERASGLPTSGNIGVYQSLWRHLNVNPAPALIATIDENDSISGLLDGNANNSPI